MTKKFKSRKMLYILLLAAIIAVIAGSIIFVCLRPSATKESAAQNSNVISLAKQDLTQSISATGTVKSANSRTVSAKVTNLTIKSVKVKVGDQVKKGETLVTFDNSDLKNALADARENLSTVRSDAERSISSARQQLSEAQETSNFDSAKAAKSVSKAKKELSDAKKQIASLKKKIKAAKNQAQKKELQTQLVKAQETKSQALSNYENALSNKDSSARQNSSSIRTAQNAVDNANSSGDKSIKEAKKQVTEAEKNLKNCSVTAPISGVVTAVNAEKGDIYSGGNLFQIDDTSSFTVTTTIDEYDISNVSVGQRTVILTEATDDEEIQGEISFIAPSTSSTISGTSSTNGGSGAVTASTTTASTDGYEVVIDITGKHDKLKMGLTAKCSIIIEEASNVFAVPYDAVHKSNNGDFVIHVTEDKNNTEKYQEIPVTKGMESDYYLEIQGESLKEGMLVIIPTDKTEKATEQNDSEQNGFDFGGQGMPDGNMNHGDRSFKKGSAGGNPPAAPGN